MSGKERERSISYLRTLLPLLNEDRNILESRGGRHLKPSMALTEYFWDFPWDRAGGGGSGGGGVYMCVYIGRHMVGRRRCRGNREKSHQAPEFVSWARPGFLHL